MFFSIILILIISALIDFPIILKIGQIEDETQDPTNSKNVFLWAFAGIVVPTVVTVIVFKFLG